MSRFVIEGEWSGYQAGQRHVVHRTVHHATERKLREWADRHGSIRYTDGTCLIITVRECKPRERVDVRPAYSKLIDDCVQHGVATVDELTVAQRRPTEMQAACSVCDSILPMSAFDAHMRDAHGV